MAVARRTVVLIGSASPVAMILGGGWVAPAAAAARSAYDRATWTPLVGSTFTMSSATSSQPVVLAAVENVAGAPSGAAQRFSLVFRSASGPLVDQVVSLQRRGFAGASLFVSSVDRGISAHHYQAVVNRTS
jgi:hypothetical protein